MAKKKTSASGREKKGASAKDKVLNRTVVELGLVSLFADISSEMLYPITPLFLTTVLGASMASVGFIEGFAECVASVLKTYAGAWSDRIEKRKPFILAGYLLSAIAKPLTGLATAWPGVFFARGLDRTGKGLRGGPRDALLSDAVVPRLRGAAFGWHRAMDTLGAAIGPLLAIWYLSVAGDNLRSIYYWAVIPGLLSVAVIFFIREAPPEKTSSKAAPEWTFAGLSKNFRAYLLAWGIFSATNSSDVFILMKAKASGVGFREVILLYCLYNLIYALASPLLGQLSDRIGRKRLMIAGLLIFAVVYTGFALADRVWEFWALFGIYGLYMAATDGVGKALAIDLIDPKMKATGVGILGTVTGLAAIVASTAAGALWDHVGPSSAFYFAVGGSLVSAACFFLLLNEDSGQRGLAKA